MTSVRGNMVLAIERVFAVVVITAVGIGGCTLGDPPPRRTARLITIPDLTGLSRSYAMRLIDNLDLEIRVEHVDPSDVDDAGGAPGTVPSGRFPGDTVLRQRPAPDTKVAPGATITLVVPRERTLRAGEERFRLMTHCGLSFPLEFDNRFWLPVDRELRRNVNAPDGFSSEGFFDVGTVRRIDEETLIYTSSTGIEVEYEPTRKRPPGCD